MKNIYHTIVKLTKGLINTIGVLLSNPQNIESNWNGIKGRDKRVLVWFIIIFFVILAIISVKYNVRFISI